MCFKVRCSMLQSILDVVLLPLATGWERSCLVTTTGSYISRQALPTAFMCYQRELTSFINVQGFIPQRMNMACGGTILLSALIGLCLIPCYPRKIVTILPWIQYHRSICRYSR